MCFTLVAIARGASGKLAPIGLFFLNSPSWLLACGVFGVVLAFLGVRHSWPVATVGASLSYLVIGVLLDSILREHEIILGIQAAMYPIGGFWAALTVAWLVTRPRRAKAS